MLIGYARVSKADGTQTTALQRDALLGAGVEPDRIYEDCASGTKDFRPGLDECKRALRRDDTLVVWKLDRLGRSLTELVHTVDALNAAGVNLRILTGPVNGDTTDPADRFIFYVMAAFAEIERVWIVEKTVAGLAAARARGRFGGRPPTPMATIVQAAELMRAPDSSPRAIAAALGISRSTLYRHVSPDGNLRPVARERLAREATGHSGRSRKLSGN